MPMSPKTHKPYGTHKATRRPFSGKSLQVADRLREHRTDSFAAFRDSILIRDNFTCRKCGAFPITGRNAHVDHIVPVHSRDDVRRYEESEVQLLCQSCHSKKTATETNNLGH